MLEQDRKNKYGIPSVATYSCDFTTSTVAGNVEFHMHDQYEIYFLLKGEIQYFVENVCYALTPGSMILFSDREIHKAINPSGYPFTRLVIHVNPAFLRQYCTLQTNLLACFHRRPGAGNLVTLTTAEQRALLLEAQSLRARSACPELYGNDALALSSLLRILVLVNQAWQRGAPAPLPVPHRVQAVMDHIEAHLTEPLTLDSIADALALDKYYLSHLFKQETESSIFRYILLRRIALAKGCLLSGCSVSETCDQCGFGDYSNFIRTFRQVTGTTPGQFRRRAGLPDGDSRGAKLS